MREMQLTREKKEEIFMVTVIHYEYLASVPRNLSTLSFNTFTDISLTFFYYYYFAVYF